MKKWILAVVTLYCCFVLCGCGKHMITVDVYDGRTQTRMVVDTGQTVGELLEEADIVIVDQDIVTPAIDARIMKDGSQIRIGRYAGVVVETEEGETQVELTGGKVGDALKKAGVVLRQNDCVNHSMEAYCTDGMRICVVHRMAVTLVVNGNSEVNLTQAHTVEEFLTEQRVELGMLDRVTPKQSAQLADGMEVVVKRVTQKEVIENEVISFETEVSYSDSMTTGTSKIMREGIDGEKRVTYQITYVDGQEEGREVVAEKIVKEPVSRQIVKGSKPKGKTVVSKERVDDCDGSGHGFYIITYSDGTVEYQDY